MYRLTCDGFPLLDWRDDDLILLNPKVKLEVNTVGEGSFTIYKNHPYYDKVQKLKSIFEVSDETSVIFRGRATGDSRDFDHGTAVDLEGVMAFFNDSVVRPYSFPTDFLENEGYIAAAESGNVVEYFLSWLIDNHNAQVEDFQRFKLGNVTVTDPNNYFTRSNSDYSSTWDTLKAKLFDSSFGGYLCIRYEDDGNYIDYLSEFTETNSQRIEFGENLLDLKTETEASMTYSAILPLGAAAITIEGQPDGDLTDDLVKSGDTIYSRKAVAAYGWIYAPTSETTWDDVTDDKNLVKKAAEWLANEGSFQLSSMEVTAVDLHFTDEQIESFRIYKNVDVYSKPHDVTETFPLDKLEIDLRNSQNTKIKIGKTLDTLTERASVQQEEAQKKYSKISKTTEEIKLEVQDELNKLSSEIQMTLEGLSFSVTNGETSSTLKLMSGKTELDSAEIKLTGVVTFAGLKAGTTVIDGGCIQTGTISADRLNLTGEITWGDLSSSVQEDINDAYSMAVDAQDAAADAIDTVGGWCYTGTTYIDGSKIMTGTVSASILQGGEVSLLNQDGNEQGTITITDADTADYAVEIQSDGAMRILADGQFAALWLEAGNAASLSISAVGSNGYHVVANRSIVPAVDKTRYVGTSYRSWAGMYSETDVVVTSDRQKKKDIRYSLAGLDGFFDDLRPVDYRFIDGTSGRRHSGFIAQDVKSNLEKHGISTADFAGYVEDVDEEGKPTYGLRYGEFISLLVDQVQKLKARVAEMELNRT